MERFSAAYGEPKKYQDVDPSLFEKHSSLPAELLEEWRANGFSVYKEGLLWFTNPDVFEDTVKSLYGKDCTHRCAARTAFGSLILFNQDNGWLYFSDLTLDDTQYPANYYIFFDFMICEQGWLRDVMRTEDFKHALKNLGPLQPDQVYAYEPHPALGGSGEADTLVKRRIFEYLDFLSQLME